MNKHDEALLSPIKESFDTIAEDFSHSRGHPWPEFGIFKHCIPDHVSILDVGCGNGRFLQYLLDQKKTVDYTGLDFSKKMIEIARKRFPQAEFMVESMTDFELEKRFDRIVAIASLHHVPTRRLRRAVLDRLQKHLKDDGLLIISVWNLWQWRYIGPLLKGFLSSVFTFFCKDPRDVIIPFGPNKVPRFYHAFLRSELRHALLAVGFLIEDEIKSTGNFIFICRKNMLKGAQSPVLQFERSSPAPSYG